MIRSIKALDREWKERMKYRRCRSGVDVDLSLVELKAISGN